jgi:hypothetical protein
LTRRASEEVDCDEDLGFMYRPFDELWSYVPAFRRLDERHDTEEHERRPGREANQHKPALWPVTPSAGHGGGTSWLDTHARLVETVKANQGPIDVLLVGDSITMQWGAAWQKHFGLYKSVNIGNRETCSATSP